MSYRCVRANMYGIPGGRFCVHCSLTSRMCARHVRDFVFFTGRACAVHLELRGTRSFHDSWILLVYMYLCFFSGESKFIDVCMRFCNETLHRPGSVAVRSLHRDHFMVGPLPRRSRRCYFGAFVSIRPSMHIKTAKNRGKKAKTQFECRYLHNFFFLLHAVSAI